MRPSHKPLLPIDYRLSTTDYLRNLDGPLRVARLVCRQVADGEGDRVLATPQPDSGHARELPRSLPLVHGEVLVDDAQRGTAPTAVPHFVVAADVRDMPPGLWQRHDLRRRHCHRQGN